MVTHGLDQAEGDLEAELGRRYTERESPGLERPITLPRVCSNSFRMADDSGVGGHKRVNQDLFGGNCEARAGKFLGRFLEFRSGRSSI